MEMWGIEGGLMVMGVKVIGGMDTGGMEMMETRGCSGGFVGVVGLNAREAVAQMDRTSTPK